MKKKIILLIVLVAAFSLILTRYFRREQSQKTKILINQLIEHPALNQTTQGIIDALRDGGYIDQENAFIRVESAQGNAALAAQIAGKFVNLHPDIVIGVATVSAQSLSKYAILGRAKLIFSTVTDPKAAKLVQSLNLPMNNTSGVSNFVALEPQLELFKKLKPELKRLGFLYNPGELNSIILIKKLEELSNNFGFSLVKVAANKTAEVPQAAIRLAQSSDAIFISNDNTALSALPSIIKAANEAKIPVFVSDTDAIAQGATAALGPNQYQVGRQTGDMILRVLQGADVNHEPVEFPKSTDLYLNLKAARLANITVPEDILRSASKIIDESEGAS
jgi:putative ABC transport system substrate-binding protein